MHQGTLVRGQRWVPAFAAVGFIHLWPTMSRPSTAHAPLAREAGRGRGPLRSNGRVRGVPVTSFFAAPLSQVAGTFTRRPLVQLSAAPRDRAPLTLPNADALGPSLSPLSRGEVYRRSPNSPAKMCAYDSGFRRDDEYYLSLTPDMCPYPHGRGKAAIIPLITTRLLATNASAIR